MKQTLGTFLKTIRIEQQFTQAQVAKHLGISRQAYAYYETSSSVPDLDTLNRLSSLYDVPIQIFLDYVSPTPPKPMTEQTNHSAGSYEQTFYPEFLEFYSQQENMKKYHHLSRPEKKMLFMFQKLTEHEQNELLLWAYFKSLCDSDINSLL